MSRAEERGKTYALHKASEKLHDYYGNAMLSVVQFNGYDIKNAYIDGYRKAEKDLELTWEDISIIRQIMFDYNRTIRNGIRNGMAILNDEKYCQEVLKQFKERKK